MRGWIEAGHDVMFVSQYAGRTDNTDVLKPVIMGYSGLYNRIHALYVRIKKNDPYANDKRFKLGWPPYPKMRKLIREFHPDLVILREKSVYSVVSWQTCKGMGINGILYNQTPLWCRPEEIRHDPAHRLMDRLVPDKRMTPVLGNPEGGIKDEKAVYIPFVMQPHLAPERREFCRNGKIHILCIGKYERRKNLLMMIKAVQNIQTKGGRQAIQAKMGTQAARTEAGIPIRLTIAGECSNRFHEEYKAELIQYIKENRLEELVELRENLGPEQVAELYRLSDLFVLPSSQEPASVSQLEAMSWSLPVICSDTNGTACYIEHGGNGYLFRNQDEDSLAKALRNAVSSPSHMKEMGEESYRLVMERHQFAQYYQKVCAMTGQGNE